jgi:hypothetical protein
MTLACADLAPQHAGRWRGFPDEKTSAARSAAPNSYPADAANGGVHLADLSSDLKSAIGPRCVSLSGLTIELMLVI